ncbi:MAG: PPOX class F420-dependent oxidoreductase [Candidatus Ranarchaeia archaeon]
MKLNAFTKKIIEKKNFAHFATNLPNGSPHVVPVWIDHDGDIVLVNTIKTSQKARNVTQDPNVALSIIDQSNPYAVVLIRGKVIEITEKGAQTHIDQLSLKYRGEDRYQGPGIGNRVIIRIQPIRVNSWER